MKQCQEQLQRQNSCAIYQNSRVFDYIEGHIRIYWPDHKSTEVMKANHCSTKVTKFNW